MKPAPKVAEPFYSSKPWRDLMAKLLRIRGRRCEACGREGCRIFGDHVVELQDGGESLDPANVKLLCGSCHTAKTVRERARRMGRSHAPSAS